MDAVSTKVVPSTLCGTLTGQHSEDEPSRWLIVILMIILPQWSWRWRISHNRVQSWSSTTPQDRPSGESGWVLIFISVVVVLIIFQPLPSSSISKKVPRQAKTNLMLAIQSNLGKVVSLKAVILCVHWIALQWLLHCIKLHFELDFIWHWHCNGEFRESVGGRR